MFVFVLLWLLTKLHRPLLHMPFELSNLQPWYPIALTSTAFMSSSTSNWSSSAISHLDP